MVAPPIVKLPNMFPPPDGAYAYYGVAAGCCINEKALAGGYY